jgi:hypothetical protein
MDGASNSDGSDGAGGPHSIAGSASEARVLPPPPAPVEVDARLIVLIGTVLWLVAFLVLLPFYGRLRDHGDLLWLWTCLCGTGLGALGLVVIRKHTGEGRLG